MTTIRIYGASDDLIEIDGDVNEEFNCLLDDGEFATLAISDGTLLRVVYDSDGIWRLTPLFLGRAAFSKQEGLAQNDTNDIVTLSGDISWIALAGNFVKID